MMISKTVPHVTKLQLRANKKSQPSSQSCCGAALGKCWLVGAGPGPADYLTIKAARLLKEAEVVVYDDLVDQDVLEGAPTAEKVYVGKRGGKSSTSQADINQVLVTHCSKGKNVVRLKGGCPSVFSRVSSEIAALTAANIPYELVPGVSSALAAPVLAGFPLTHVTLSTAFTVFSGHDVELQDWTALAKIPSLVVLMGGRQLSIIANSLLQNGRDPETPVCIIRAAGMAEQEVWAAPLNKIVDRVHGKKLSPCIVVVGQVSALRPNPS